MLESKLEDILQKYIVFKGHQDMALSEIIELIKVEKEHILNEVERRQLMIISEPDGLVRETMIHNLLMDLD